MTQRPPRPVAVRESIPANQVVEKLRRDSYLQQRGVNLSEPIQLDLLYPDTLNNSQRAIPNDVARSSLFTARNKREPRRNLTQEKLFHLHEGVSVLYTGIELRAADDEIIWLQILHYAKSVPLGSPFEFTVKQLVADAGWSKNGAYYDNARKCISRLRANEVLIANEKAYGVSVPMSLIENYVLVNDGDGSANRYRVWIHPGMIVLFAGNTFTNHSWDTYRDLSPVARRLADYVESHKIPFPLQVERFRLMCGSSSQALTGWRRTVRQACQELEDKQLVQRAYLEDDNIFTIR